MASTDESDPSAPPLAPNLTREISHMETTAVASGGYSIVFRAERRPPSGPPQLVVVKVPVLSNMAKDDTKILKRLKREIRVWTRLSHPNIVPLLGIIDEPHGPGMVSPFFPEGTALQFLKKYPDANREVLCLDIACGLKYLHSQKPQIIHGDIKGINVLISPDGVACLCDFGLSLILDDAPTGFTNSVFGGTLRYFAPELLEQPEKTVETDLYGLGCLCIEFLFDAQPYSEIQGEAMVIKAIGKNTPPYDIPEAACQFLLFPLDLLVRCWERDPSQRPSLDDIIERTHALLHQRHIFNQTLHTWIGCDVLATGRGGEQFTGTLCAVSTDTSSIELEAPTPSRDQPPAHYTIPLYRRSQWQISVSASCDRVLESSVHCAVHASISDRPSEDSTAVEQTCYSTSTYGGGSLESDDHTFYSLFRITSPSEGGPAVGCLVNDDEPGDVAVPDSPGIQITKELEWGNATSLDVDEQVQSGTVFALIDRLTSPLFRYEDLAFRNTFIETFPDFTTINDVFHILRERFYADSGDNEDKKASAVHTRVRVISTIKEILEEHDFSNPEELLVLDEIETFLNDLSDMYPVEQHVSGLVHIIRSGSRTPRSGKVNRSHPLMPISRVMDGPLILQALHPFEIACHLTFMAHELLRNVQRKTLLYHGTDRQPLDDSVAQVLMMQKKVSKWASRTIQEAGTSEQRKVSLEHLISVATGRGIVQHCQALRSFSVMSAIAGGLSTSFRQERTRASWAESPEIHQVFKIMRDIPENSSEYRRVLQDHPLPCIPDISKYITALLLVRETMNDFEDAEKQIVNFRKPQRLASIMTEFRKYQQHPYNFLVFEPVLSFLDHALNHSE